MPPSRIIVVLGLALGGALVVAGCAADQRYSQAQLDAIQMRSLDRPADRVYRGVIGALIEQDFQILESDMSAGLLVAATVVGDEWEGFRRRTLQITVLPEGERAATVRISTSADGQTRVDEGLIGRLHQRIDVHVHTPVTEVVWEPAP